MSEQSTDVMTAVAMGTPLDRVDGREKVTGHAAYAVEHGADDDLADPLHLWLVQSTIARGTITRIDTAAALAHPGVTSVVDHTNAARLADTDDLELAVLQEPAVGFRGQIVAVVVAETPEAAREGARLVEVHYDEEPARVELTDDAPTYTPEKVNPAFPPDSGPGRRRVRAGRGRRAGRGDLPHGLRAQQPDGAARPDRHLGRLR